MELTPQAVQEVLVRDIANPSTPLDRVEALYRQAREGDEAWDWPAIDCAVVARMGPIGLALLRARAAAHAPYARTA